jgi:hypothetical protein
MSRSTWCGCIALIIVLASVAGAHAQSTASVSGTVKDASGGVMPGVTVTVKDDATSRAQESVTTAEGRYQVAGLQAGSYTVTASLSGFKTASAKVRLAPGQPLTIVLTLEVGALTETVVVMSSAELINTETATVSATLNSDQLTRMPTPTRNALNAIAFLPGVNTPGVNRDSTINGLPESFLSITLDGVSNNDNFLRNTDSFFATVTPRQDAVEAVAVTLAAGGAGGGAGSGAMTMAFQTRAGGNRFTGSAYEYHRDPSYNTTYIFNQYNHQAKNQVKLDQFGARAGGPIVIPGVYDGRNKAFFFVHYEQIRFPNSFTRTRTVFNPRVLDGFFRYQCPSGTCEVNLLQLAAANGQIATKDPTTSSIQQMILAATATTGTRSTTADPIYDSYVWQSPSALLEYQPTARVDYNLTDRHRLAASFAVITATRTPDYLNSADPRFPGAPNHRDFVSTRPFASLTLRSTIKNNIQNELVAGINSAWRGSNFGFPSDTPSGNDPSSFKDQGGFAISTPTSTTDWYTSNGPSWRIAPTYSADERLTWLKGAHTMAFGASLLISNAKSGSQQIVPGITLGFDTTYDPAASMFNTSNFPGASSANLTAAQAVYAVLTGRVASVNSAAVLDPGTGKYKERAPVEYKGGFKVFSVFAQDSWKLASNLTLTGGLRWEVQTPFSPSTSLMSNVSMASICGMSGTGSGSTAFNRCNVLNPTASGGVATPQFDQFKAGTTGYKTDWNNVGPSLSIAWRPNVQSGFLRALLGDPEQATLRAGYAIAFDRAALTQFTGQYGNNNGSQLTLTRNASSGLVPAGESWPVLLSQSNRLYTASFNPDPTYPIPVRAGRVDTLYTFAPDIKIGRVQNWNIAFARSISKDMAIELRYIGNVGDHEWATINYNTIRGENLAANGFMNEFKLAMANLAANNAAGGSRLGSFAYFGSGTGTNPLPIYLAYLNGSRDATNPAAYTGGSATWSSSTVASRLVGTNPNPVTAAVTDLDGTASRRTNAALAGYPANFFIPNPAVGTDSVYESAGISKYGALQVELRRRLSHGFSASINYQWAFPYTGVFDGFSYGYTQAPVADVRHAIKMQWDWTLPFGRGQRFGSNMGTLANVLVGGWSFNGVGRAQRVRVDMGNVRLVGMTIDDLQKMYKYYYKTNASGVEEVWMLPDDVILNTRRAFSTASNTVDGYSTSLGAPTGKYIAPANSAACVQARPGDCAPRNNLILAPWFVKFDLGVTKRIDIHGKMNIELRLDVLNVFDKPNFNPWAPSSTQNWAAATIFQVTSAYTDASNTYDPGGRIGQLMIRFNW